MALFIDRFKDAWNAFLGRDPTNNSADIGPGYFGSSRPDRYRVVRGGLRATTDVIYNKIAVDVSSIDIRHVRVNEEGKYQETIKSTLNRALTKEANIDQTGRELIISAILTMFDEGVVAIVPSRTDKNPDKTDSFKIYELRAGRIVAWYPKKVRVDLYNEDTGHHEEILVDKRYTVIIENPFYTIMNERNSVGQRLARVQRQLDLYNEDSISGKMDLIIQVPYTFKSETIQKRAAKRRKDIEFQLTNSKYGIAYIDGTEKVTQLNRSLENNLWTQAKELQQDLFNQLGFTQSIFDGTADEQTTLNYRNRTLEPILNAIVENMERKWISITAETQGQAIRYFSDPFKLVPVAKIADIADKFTRNEIMTSNELRSVIGLIPSKDPKADELRNSNLNHPDEKMEVQKQQEKNQNEESINVDTQNRIE